MFFTGGHVEPTPGTALLDASGNLSLCLVPGVTMLAHTTHTLSIPIALPSDHTLPAQPSIEVSGKLQIPPSTLIPLGASGPMQVDRVATPEIHPAKGQSRVCSGSCTLSFHTITDGAAMYYTLNTSVPSNTSGIQYTSPLDLFESSRVAL